MAAQKKNAKSKKIQHSKTGVPILGSDQDFLSAFEPDSRSGASSKTESQDISQPKTDFPDSTTDPLPPDEGDEDFSQLLEEYSQKSTTRFVPQAKKVPLKKRLKRYPKAELDLDLHGLTANPARIKLRSFIHTCKNRGFYTVRIIVGRGLHSSEGPVLPDMAEDEIRELQSQGLVLWYEWEKKNKKDSGAMIVYLKQFERYDG